MWIFPVILLTVSRAVWSQACFKRRRQGGYFSLLDVVGFVFGRLRHAAAKPAFPGLWVGLLRGFEPHLSGIIGVCFTVALTHVVSDKQACACVPACTRVSVQFEYLALWTPLCVLCGYTVDWCDSACCRVWLCGWALRSETSCNFQSKQLADLCETVRHNAALLLPGGHTSCRRNLLRCFSPKQQRLREERNDAEAGWPVWCGNK